MTTSSFLDKALKVVPIIIAVVVILLQSWLILINKEVFKTSEISMHLNSVQEASHAMSNDLLMLRDHLTNEDQVAIDEFIELKMPLHKQWLKEIIYGQTGQHPLVIFSEKYLRLLKGLANEPLSQAFTTRLDLFELVDNVTKHDNNILTLSKQRSVENYSLLKRNVVFAELITVIIIILLIFFFFSTRLNNKRQKENNYKAQKLSLFFIDYPVALVRLSSRGNVRYYNKQASSMMRKYNIKKAQLIPQNIKRKLNTVIERPNKVIRFTHTLNDTPLYCDIRLCPDSGQIYMMINESTNEQAPGQSMEDEIASA